MLNLKYDGLFGPVRFSKNGFAITSRQIVKAAEENGVYVWRPIKVYDDVSDPRDK